MLDKKFLRKIYCIHPYMVKKSERMEKVCEFCAALRPIVFCKADSAFLCLSCDAKVHSANALSNRHFRCLVCESCTNHPAYVRCVDHQMLLCRACDATLHGNTAKVDQHQKRVISSFTGSPSAKQFAVLWGFDANQLALQEHLALPSTSSVSSASVVSTDKHKMPGKDEQQPWLIMQQIVELNRLQLSESYSPLTGIRERRQSHSSSSVVYNTLGRIEECLEDAMMHGSNGSSDGHHALKEDPHFLTSPLAHSEYFGEPFWQSRIALESNQFWPQTLEEPRVSEEFDSLDVFKMPEVDMTFPNFEELLRGDDDLSRALLDDEYIAHATDISHLSVESSGSDFYDNKPSGADQQDTTNIEGRRNTLPGQFKDKRMSRLRAKKIQLASRKNKAEPNKNGLKATRSC